MQNNILSKIEKYKKKHKQYKIWQKIVGSLACMVVFVTTYMLILPAITMEKSAFCGMEEHQHGAECYEQRLSCGYGEEPETAHIHNDSCYESEQVLICGQEESTGHVHNENCVEKEQVLICTDTSEEHVHTDACYEEKTTYICGKEEGEGAHTHGPECYETRKVLICDQPENTSVHTHTDACYEKVMVCGKEEHIHSLNCFSNPEADVESSEDWERSVSDVELTGIWADDVIAIAQSQIGYTESTENYQVQEDGKTMKGYTRYGAWYGNEYGDWCAMFVSFCLNYADIPESAVPYEASCSRWIESLSDSYHKASGYTPVKGDIIFFDNNGDGTADHVGLVEKVNENNSTLKTIEGNSSDKVKENSYSLSDDEILGYGMLPENPEMVEDENGEETEARESSAKAANYATRTSDTEESSDATDTGDDSEGGNTGENTGGDGESTANNTLPVNELSGNGTKYDPATDLFTTNVRIEFEFTNSIAQANTVYTYTYPEGIVVPDDVVNKGKQDLYDGETKAGTYQFIKNTDGTYSVQVIFSEGYIQSAGSNVTGYVQFEGYFSKEDMNQKGEIVIGADDAIVFVPAGDITYPKDETESYNIDVSKSGSWVQDGDKLVYIVYVRTTKGTPALINLTDMINIPEGLTLGTPDVKIEKGTSNYYANWDNTWRPTDLDNSWNEVKDISHTYDNGNLSISLPALSAEKTKDSNNSDCIVGDVYRITYIYPITDQTVASVSPENNVTVSAKDTTKGQTVTDTAQSTVDINKDLSYKLDKYGAETSDKSGYIKWTVTVNSNNVNINGAKLTDDMLGLIENAVDIVVYPAEGAVITKDADGKITNIIFGEVENGKNKNKYTIIYYTPVEESWDDTVVTNNAKLDPTPDKEDGDEIEKNVSVTVSGVKLNKTGVYDGATNKINWTITVNPGNQDIAGATLTDDMFTALSDTDFTIEPVSGYTFLHNSDNQITGIIFSATEDDKNTQTYVIKYSTDVTKKEDGTLDSVTNSATLSPGAGKNGTPVTVETTVTPDEVQLTKSGTYEWNECIKWTITVNASNRNIAGAVLTDEIFSQLSIADISIHYNGDWDTVPSNEYTIHTNEDNKITDITFNAIGDTEINTKKYVITYSTAALKEWENRTVHNEANLTLDGKKINAPADVIVQGDGSISKAAGEAELSEDGKTLIIPWTVALSIPKGGLSEGISIVDDLTKGQWGMNTYSQWMTRSQITEWATNMTWTDNNDNSVGGTNAYNPPPEQITFLASNGNTYTYKQISEYKVPVEEGNVNFEELKYTLFTIYFPEGLTPPEGATKLTFTYYTTADVSDVQVGATTYYNYIQAGSKPTEASYTYYKPGVVKTDGNGKTNATEVSNEGTLTWKIKASVGKNYKKLTLIDTLPEGVTLDSLQLTGWGNLNMTLTVNGETISGEDSTNQYNVSGTIENNIITLDIVSKTDGNAIQTGAEFTLAVTCTVNDAENQMETKTLTNTAVMLLDDISIGSSSQTQEWTYLESVVNTKVVNKSGSWKNDNRIMEYTVILNEEGKDLLPESDTLTLIDTMTYAKKIWLSYEFGTQVAYSIDASLMQNSVKLYKAVKDDDGNWVTGETVDNWSWTYEVNVDENSWNISAANIITATGIPDGTPLILQYSYRVTSNVPDELNGKEVYFDLAFTNEVKLEGTEQKGTSSSSGTKWEHPDSSAGVTTEKSYTFYKVEAGNYNVSLSGAVFSVYKYDLASHEYGTEPVKTYSTDSIGSFKVTQQEKDTDGSVTFSYDTNTLYKIVETNPPKGYELPNEVKTYYFYFSSSEDAEHTLPDDDLLSDAVDLSEEAKTVYVENVKNCTEITVQKQWQDSAGDNANDSHAGDTVTLNLYRKAISSENSGSEETSGNGETSGEGTGVSVSVKIGNYDFSGTIYDSSYDCYTGDIIRITIKSWGTPEVQEICSDSNINVPCVSSTPGNGNASTYVFQYTVGNTNATIQGKTNDNATKEDVTVERIPTQITPSTPESNPTTTPDSTESTTAEEGENKDKLVGTVTIGASDGWTYTFTRLDKAGKDKDDNIVPYYYYVVEEPKSNYTTSYSNNDGITEGTITVTNKANDTSGFELPETGGSGTKLYTLGGLLLALSAGIFLLYNYTRRRKEDRSSS